MKCALCDRDANPALRLGELDASCCLACAWRVGRLVVGTPHALVLVWPTLWEDEDEGPEPKVRLPDGTSVELRSRTAELKQELTVEKRLELAVVMGEMGLARERLLEAGYVLSTEASADLAQKALDLLFVRQHLGDDAIGRLRPLLLPC
jgi:hypothetical protein